MQRRAPFTINELIAISRSADDVEVSCAGYGGGVSRRELRDPAKGIAILEALKLRSPLVRHDADVVFSSEARGRVIFSSTKAGYLFDLNFIGTAAVIVTWKDEEFIADLADDRAVRLLLQECASEAK